MVEHGGGTAAAAVTQSVQGAQRGARMVMDRVSSVSLSAVSDDPKSEMHGSFSNGISHFHLTRESSRVVDR